MVPHPAQLPLGLRAGKFIGNEPEANMSDALLPFPWLDLILILALVALNGVLSMSELAIVSAREARLKAMVKAGSSGAKYAVDLAAEPGRFISTVQIGITLIGILAGAYPGASLGTPVGPRLALLGLDPETAKSVGFGVVIVITTFASLVIGELVPKQFALRNPEGIAAVMARPMFWLSKATAPVVWLLDKTSELIFRLLGLNRENRNVVTAEELHLVVAEAQSAGVLEESERAIISGIVRLADRPVREVMTPRTDIDWIDIGSSREQIRAALAETPHSRLPVAEGSVDNIIGVVATRDMLTALLDGQELNIRALTRSAPVIPDLMDAMDALAALRSAEVPLALVHDEYGHLDGIVTPGSILTALAGAFAHDLDAGEDPPCVEREDGSWLVSGAANADLLGDRIGVAMPGDRDYSTVAGFALSVLRKIPETGEIFKFDGYRFEVVDMDGRKIDKLLVSRPKRKPAEEEASSDRPPA
jgi:putative hemolysin